MKHENFCGHSQPVDWNDGKKIIAEVTGPLTLIDKLEGLSHIFRDWRKDREHVRERLKAVSENILLQMNELKLSGAEILSFADPIGTYEILGPVFSRYMAEDFLIPFLKQAEKLADERTLIHVCPRTSHMLIKLGLAEWREITGSQARITGFECIKSKNPITDNEIIKELILKE